MFVLGLAACHPARHAPEGRAQDFIEALVTAPADAQKLRDIANIAPERNPDDLVDDLSARVALDFLRARQVQGVALQFHQGESRRIDASRRSVTILVTYLQPGTQSNDKVSFQVLLEVDKEGQWRIAHVKGGN
jgi:hypothetical protein